MPSLSDMVILLLAIPLLGSVLCLSIPNSKPKLISIAATLVSFAALGMTLYVASLSATGNEAVKWDWFSIGTYAIEIHFEFTHLTLPMILLVAAITFLVHLYSIGFVERNKSSSRYFATLGLFTFSMLGLALSGNLFQLFIFWELVGLCSYLLIGYYRHKPEAAHAATKSFILNKIGDVGFLIALMLLWSVGSGFEIARLESSALTGEFKTLLSLAILLAVFTKSAQFPFHTWLPEAMEGPTPVSALIHSATMVAAGIFLMARLHFLFTPITLQLTVVAGSITALIGGLNALRENDLKRILAWSTISQLGLMTMVAGNEGFNASFVHLLAHGIFKAGLFLSVGFILLNRDEMVGEEKPVGKPVILIGAILFLCFSLMGIPLTTGFLSKEIMLGALTSSISIALFFIINMLTIFYTVRLMFLMQVFRWPIEQMSVSTSTVSAKYPPIVFAESPVSGTLRNGERLAPPQSPEAETLRRQGLGATLRRPNLIMSIPVVALAIGCLWIFFSWSPLSASWANQKWMLADAPVVLTIASVIWILVGTAAAFSITHKGKISAIGNWIPAFDFDRVLQSSFVKPILVLAQASQKSDTLILDRGIRSLTYLTFSISLLAAWFDKMVVDGLARAVGWCAKLIGNLIRQLVTGKIQGYVVWTVLALIALLLLAKK